MSRKLFYLTLNYFKKFVLPKSHVISSSNISNNIGLHFLQMYSSSRVLIPLCIHCILKEFKCKRHRDHCQTNVCVFSEVWIKSVTSLSTKVIRTIGETRACDTCQPHRAATLKTSRPLNPSSMMGSPLIPITVKRWHSKQPGVFPSSCCWLAAHILVRVVSDRMETACRSNVCRKCLNVKLDGVPPITNGLWLIYC